MMKQQWLNELDELYGALRDIVLEQPDNVDPAIVELLLKEEYYCRAITDQNILKYSLLFSHHGWEHLYRVQRPEMKECLGDWARNLAECGDVHIGIPQAEMELIRHEVLKIDTDYSDAIEALHKAEVGLAAETPPDGHLRFFKPLIRLQRWGELLHHLRAAIVEAPDDALRQMYSAFIIELIPIEFLSDADLDQALMDFRATRELNYLAGYYDPVEFDLSCAELIRKVVERKIEALPPIKEGEARTRIMDRLMNLQATTRRNIVDIDTSRIRALDESILELMREHDSLLLANAQSHLEDGGYDIFFFRGSKVRWFRSRVNLAYPGKAEDLEWASREVDYHQIFSTALAGRARVKQRLNVEFPGFLEEYYSEDED